MRKLVFLGVIIAAVWCGWWILGANALEKGVIAWADETQEVDLNGTSKGGFPFYFKTRMQNPTISDGQGSTFVFEHIDVKAAAWWPGNAQVLIPDGQIAIQSQTPATLDVEGTQAAVRLHPGTALALGNLSLNGAVWALKLPEGDVIRFDDVQADVTETESNTYHLSYSVGAVTPGSIIRQAMNLGPSWPDAFEKLRGDMTVTFDRPWDRHAMNGPRPQPRKIVIQEITSVWGTQGQTLTADLTVDANGVPAGEVFFEVQNWVEAINIAQKAGFIDPDMRKSAESIFGMLARLDGDDANLSVKIDMSGGQMRMGFLPLGPAPKLILR